VTHARNEIANGSEIGGPSSTPKACVGGWSLGGRYHPRRGRAVCFSIIRTKARIVVPKAMLSGWRDAFKFVSEIFEVIRVDEPR